jgi:hypothetical protein
MAITLDDEDDIKTTIKGEQGKIIVVRSQDVEGYLKQNERERNEAATWRPYAARRRGDSGLRKVADIPNVVVEQWLREGVNVFSKDPDMQKKVRRKLDDYTNQKLRTMPGRLGVRTRHF